MTWSGADPAGIRTWAASLRAAAERLHDLAAFALSRSRVDDWSGGAAAAYAGAARTVGADCDRAATTLHGLADRVDRHADVVARLDRLAAHDPDVVEPEAHLRAELLAEEQDVRRALEAATAEAGRSTAARHRANVAVLQRDLARLGSRTGDLTAEEQQRLAIARSTAAALTRIEAARDPVTGRPVPASLYVYDPHAFGGDGRVAVVAGDLANADDVALVVPGLGTDATSAFSQAERALAVHEAARHLDPGAANATMAWLGYDAPDNPPLVIDGDVVGVFTDRMAREGGHRLATTVAGLRAGPSGDAHLSVVGYSYGSTTAALAVSASGSAVDDLLLVGSPGAGRATDSAADTGLPAGHVWVLRDSDDPVTALGGHGWAHAGHGGLGLGVDPAGAGWGATRLQAEWESRDGQPWADHGGYFEHDTESLHNIAAVVAGDAELATAAPPVRDPWWRPPMDPERGRPPTSPATGP